MTVDEDLRARARWKFVGGIGLSIFGFAIILGALFLSIVVNDDGAGSLRGVGALLLAIGGYVVSAVGSDIRAAAWKVLRKRNA